MTSNQGTFSQIPAVFLDTCDLPDAQQMVFIRLWRETYNGKNEWQGSIRKLAKVARVSVGTAFTAKTRLENAKLFEVTNLPNEKNNADSVAIRIKHKELWDLNEYYCNGGKVEKWKVLPIVEGVQNLNRGCSVDDTGGVQKLNGIVQNLNRGCSEIEQSQAHGCSKFEQGVFSPQAQNTPLYITSIDNIDVTSNISNRSGVADADASKSKKRSTLKSKLASLESFDFDQPASIENIMLLGDCWRGGALPALKRADSDYQKALLQGATPLSQRLRPNSQCGYTLREINDSYRFFKRIPPEGRPQAIADEWWIGKPIDLWVVAKNIDRALIALAKSDPKMPNPNLTKEEKPQIEERVLWSRTIEDMPAIEQFKHTRRGEVDKWEALRDAISWEWMTEGEALNYGWEEGRVFSDRERRELFAAKERMQEAVS